ncbi:MAG: sigma-70 family RNA polymerase sigma factor [Nanoarchaeota archaeon]
MVRQNYDLSLFSVEALKYSQTTKDEEIMYGKAIRQVVDSNPGIIAATNIVLLEERVPEKFKKLLGLEGMKFEEMKDVARGYLKLFNNLWENGEVEYWLERRDTKTWNKFSKLQKYNASKRALVTANLRLAIASARSFNKSWLSVEDSVQMANIGLEKAVLRYDPDRGVRFGTYASNWIMQMLRIQLPEEIYALPLPNQLFKDINKIKKIQRSFFEENARTPGLEEIINMAKMKSISSRTVRSAIKIRETTKIHIGRFEEGGVEPEDKSLGNLLESTIKIEDKKSVYRMMDCLDERERRVIMLRFGICNGNDSDEEQEPMKLREIRKYVGDVSVERVRQIQNRALEKMKRLHSRIYF